MIVFTVKFVFIVGALSFLTAFIMYTRRAREAPLYTFFVLLFVPDVIQRAVRVSGEFDGRGEYTKGQCAANIFLSFACE